MRKVARMVSRLAGDREYDLLDVGCGPGTLQRLMPSNVPITASTSQSPRLRITCLRRISWKPRSTSGIRFDFVVAQGISSTWASTSHRIRRDRRTPQARRQVRAHVPELRPQATRGLLAVQQCPAPGQLPRDLSRFFKINRSFPLSHNWNHSQPRRPLMKASQAHINLNVPSSARCWR